MSLAIEATHKKWIKASEEWTQESRKGVGNETHFDRNFSIDDLKFNVKLKTCRGYYSCCPCVFIETGSHEIIDDFKIQIDYSAEGKSGSLTFIPSVESLSKFKSECKYEN